MDDCGGVLDLLKELVADRLGASRVEAMFQGLQTRRFDAYLLSDPDGMPPAADYKPKIFSSRSGVDYFRPDGWVQVWLTEIDSDPDFAALRDWPVAYHGTDSAALGSILEAGLRKPGELPSVQVKHGQAGAGPDGAIYATPSLWLASHPVYSTFLEVGPNKWVQFVFKLRVRPGSYRTQPSTLSASKHWEAGLKLDPNFYHNEALEWLIAHSSDVRVVGLMVRELGAAAHPQIFGGLATKVSAQPPEGADFCWTGILQQALRSAGFTIDNGIVHCFPSGVEWQIPLVSEKIHMYAASQAIQSSLFTLPTRAGCGTGHFRWYPNAEKDGEVHIGIDIRIDLCLPEPICVELMVGMYTTRCLGLWIKDLRPGRIAFKLASHLWQVTDSSADDLSAVLRVLPVQLPEQMRVELDGQHVFWTLDARALNLEAWQHSSSIASDLWSTPPSCHIPGMYHCSLIFFPQSCRPWDEYCELCLWLHRKEGVPKEDQRHLQIRYRLKINDNSMKFTRTVGELVDARGNQLWMPLRKAMKTGRIVLECSF